MDKREFDPIVGQFPDREKVQCATCKHRLKIVIAGKDIGPANAYCEEYTEEETDGKPIGVLFQKQKCHYYEEDAE